MQLPRPEPLARWTATIAALALGAVWLVSIWCCIWVKASNGRTQVDAGLERGMVASVTQSFRVWSGPLPPPDSLASTPGWVPERPGRWRFYGHFGGRASVPAWFARDYAAVKPRVVTRTADVRGHRLELWIPCVVAALSAALLWYRHVRRRMPGHCAACRYDLAGVAGSQCPECGAATAGH